MLETFQETSQSADQYESLMAGVTSISTLDFLKRILPQDGIHFLALFKEGNEKPEHKAYTDLETMAYAIEGMANNKQLAVYHACASYQKAVIELDELNEWGNPKRKYRIPENWDRAKAFWVDIDCGKKKFDAGQGYLTKRDAIAAVYKFNSTIGWPEPMIVDSGNGIHLYWPLRKDIGHNAWCKVASILKATLAHEGVIADPSRTADFASILRPIGSVNRKEGSNKPVVAKTQVEASDPNELATKLISYAHANGVKLIKEAPKIQFQETDLNSDLTDHLTQYSQVPADANLMANKCAQVAAMRDSRGDVSYEHWRFVIGLLTYCENGRTLAEEWSAKREATGHTNLDWDVRYDTWSAGPTVCETFESCNPTGCSGCPMKGKIKTPLVLGTMVDGANAAPSVSKSVLIEKLPDWYRTKDGKAFRPMQTTANLKAVMELFGWSELRFNEMTKKVELAKIGMFNGRHDQDNAALVLLGDDVLRAGMSREGLLELVETIGGENSYHPCKEWVESMPWDGVSRLGLFHDTLVLEDPTKAPLRDKLIDAWMLQGIGALEELEGIAAQGVITVVAPQARNKTRWVSSLCPVPGAVRTGLHIDPLNKDSVFAATGSWITEAGELDTTTRKSDVGALKAFFTRSLDVLRPPYAKRENEYRRRTVFVGTVNGTGFLHDTTGNRRYWTVAVNRCELITPVQMQQVWAEYLHKYRQGDRWFLEATTLDALNEANLDFTVTEPLRDLICSKFDWQSVNWSIVDPVTWRNFKDVGWLTATAICEKVGYVKATRADATRAGAIVRELQQVNRQGIASSRKEICRNSNGAKLLAVPKTMIGGL
jgi:predicted P-loop ATPase